MTTKYYDLEATMERYEDSPSATAFLQRIIDNSCPDAFHWCDVETARNLALEDEIAATVNKEEMERNNTMVALYRNDYDTVYAYKMHIIAVVEMNDHKPAWSIRERLSGKVLARRESIQSCVAFIDIRATERLSQYYKTGI